MSTPPPADAGLPARCGWFVALGVALLVLGLIAFGNLFIAIMVSVLHVGVLMFIGAVAQIVHAFQVKKWGAFFFWPLSGVLYGLTAASHRDLERLLVGVNGAYNARRQRVLDGRSAEEVVRERLARDKTLANPGRRPPSDPCILPKALLVIEAADEVWPSDNQIIANAVPSLFKPGHHPTTRTPAILSGAVAVDSVARRVRRTARGDNRGRAPAFSGSRTPSPGGGPSP